MASSTRTVRLRIVDAYRQEAHECEMLVSAKIGDVKRWIQAEFEKHPLVEKQRLIFFGVEHGDLTSLSSAFQYRDLSAKQHGIFVVINDKDYYKTASPSSKSDSKNCDNSIEDDEDAEQMRTISSPELRSMSVNLAVGEGDVSELGTKRGENARFREDVPQVRRSGMTTSSNVGSDGAVREIPSFALSPSRTLRYQLQQLVIQADSQRNQWRLRRRFYETTNPEESRRAGVIEQEWESRRIQLLRMGESSFGPEDEPASTTDGMRRRVAYREAANDDGNDAVGGAAVGEAPQRRGARLMLFLDVRLLLKLALLVLILAQDGGTERLVFLVACACVVYIRQMRLLELMLRGRPPAAADNDENGAAEGGPDGANAAMAPAGAGDATNTVFSRFRSHFISGVLRRSTGEWWEYMYDFAYTVLGFVLSLIPTWRPHTLDPPPRFEMDTTEGKSQEEEKEEESEGVAEKRDENADNAERIEAKRADDNDETVETFDANVETLRERDADDPSRDLSLDAASTAAPLSASPLTDEGLRRRRLRHLQSKREAREANSTE